MPHGSLSAHCSIPMSLVKPLRSCLSAYWLLLMAFLICFRLDHSHDLEEGLFFYFITIRHYLQCQVILINSHTGPSAVMCLKSPIKWASERPFPNGIFLRKNQQAPMIYLHVPGWLLEQQLTKSKTNVVDLEGKARAAHFCVQDHQVKDIDTDFILVPHEFAFLWIGYAWVFSSHCKNGMDRAFWKSTSEAQFPGCLYFPLGACAPKWCKHSFQ